MPRLAVDGLSGLEVEDAVGELFELVGERRGRDHGSEHEFREADVDEFSDEAAHTVDPVGHEVADVDVVRTDPAALYRGSSVTGRDTLQEQFGRITAV